jgi:hypothetical protein
METVFVASTLRNLQRRPPVGEDIYYSDFAPRAPRLRRLASVAAFILGAFLTYGLMH